MSPPEPIRAALLRVREQALDASTCLSERSLKTEKPRKPPRKGQAGWRRLANSPSGPPSRDSAALCSYEGAETGAPVFPVSLTVESRGCSLLSAAEPEVSEPSPTSHYLCLWEVPSAGCHEPSLLFPHWGSGRAPSQTALVSDNTQFIISSSYYYY